ncbi:8-amino-7-oxononanoate synthase [Alteribacillus sp. HJP-4]|uniref:8-amino-7-oxononanoate synthase n=1 Tax=Alteribacillus sp. HJP-4 TaxID=2775394 RepID=UPI0035CCE2F7
MNRPVYSWAEEALEKIENLGLYRKTRKMESSPAGSVVIGRKEMIMASSNNYLGLASHPETISAAAGAVLQFGVGSSGSRLTTGTSPWHEELELKIAAYKRTDAALLFSSGYLANIGVISTIAGEEDIILSDELNHASLIDGCRLSKAKTSIYRHTDMLHLEALLTGAKHFQNRFIVTDGVFSMDGDIAPLPEITRLAKKYKAYVIVDDAHGTGVLGDTGRGTPEYFQEAVDLSIGTLSKAIGTEGGFAAGSRILIELLRNRARTFIFQTALPPASAAAALAAIEIMDKEPERLQQLQRNIRFLQERLASLGFSVSEHPTPILPIFIGEAKAAVHFAEILDDEGIYAPAIRPPTVPEGKSRIRVTVMADHTIDQLQKVCAAFQKAGRELELI